MPETYQWRKAVFVRDDFTCQCCGDAEGGNLCAHHIKGWAEFVEGRFDVANGVAMCEPCHIRFHQQYGHKGIGGNELHEFQASMTIASI